MYVGISDQSVCEVIFMLKEIQVNKTDKKVYCMDEDYHVFAELPIGTEFYEGYNDNGEEYSNAEDGIYPLNRVDIDYPDNVTPSYGWGYINIDERGRALHGGGANLGHIGAVQPYQSELMPTLGCFRMYNADVFWLCHQAELSRNNGIEVIIHVVS
jgi:hypothetical protein